MKTVVIIAFGSRGDVAPFTGLGVRLAEAGYRVAIAACEPYADLVRDAGLEYRFLPKDPHQGARTEAGQRYMADGSSLRAQRKLIPDIVEGLRGVGPAIAGVSKDADILLPGVIGTLFAYHVAEALGIPSIGTFLLPTTPTGDFPPAVMGIKSLGRWGNRTVAKLAGQAERVYFDQVNELRRELGLPTITLNALRRRQNAEQWPILHGFSPHLVPRPRDWRPGLDITGYWWPETPKNWTPPADLAAFLDAGPPPVFAGFGSSAINQGEHFSEIIVKALRKTGLRAVIQSGWAGLQGVGDDMLTIGEAPYTWLFPRMSLLVHHAGAGTTAAGLRAGVPAIPVPGIVDQHFWGKRLVDLGLAPCSIKQKDLDADQLAATITAATTDGGYRRRAKEMAARLATEDGAAAVIEAVRARV